MKAETTDQLITVLWVLGSLVFLAVVTILYLIATASAEDFRKSELMEVDNV